MELTLEAVLSLSPDEASTKAARGLTSLSKWPTLGANDQALWGECQGSGSKPYQTQVDLTGMAFRCTCPSRKFPCKHGLALLLLRCNAPAAFASTAATTAPAWVSEWLASRVEKAAQSEQKAALRASAPTPEPATLAKRQASEAKRWHTIHTGLEQLQLWMADHIERGLASMGQGQRAGFHTQAARLVDAVAPGLAQRLKDAGDAIGAQPGWPANVLQTFGSLQLIADAVAQRDSLPEPVLADLKSTLGWPMDKADVIATGTLLEDDFTVLGVAAQPRDAKVTERRVWLQGHTSGQRALLLEFSYAGSGFESVWATGSSTPLALRFYPSASPLRAVVAGQSSTATATPASPKPDADEWLTLAQRFAANPWLPLAPMVFENSTPVFEGDAWFLHTGQNRLPLRLNDESGWLLAAHSGGHSLAVFGEWDGKHLTPLTAWGPDGLWLNAGLT